jgi:glycosyltransferase involved in cell wall biosynthesis
VDAGGQNVHVAELARAVARAGHEVEVWTRRDAPGLPASVPFAPGVTVRHMDAGPAEHVPKDQLVPHVPRMAQVLEDAWVADPPDVVHAHFWMSGLAAVAAARRPAVPVVQTFHALGAVKRRHQGEEDTSPRGRVSAELAVAGRAARVIATCSDEAFELARMGVPRSRVSVVPCGVDTEQFSAQGPTAVDGVPDRRPGVARLVSIGRLVRRKGVDELITAMRRLPKAELLVAGGPPPAHLDADPDVARLRAVAVSAGVADRVRFLGAVPRDSVPPLLRSADAVVCVPWRRWPAAPRSSRPPSAGSPTPSSTASPACTCPPGGPTSSPRPCATCWPRRPWSRRSASPGATARCPATAGTASPPP